VPLDCFSFARGLDEKKKTTDKGIEYWMGRDLMPLLAYVDWRNFGGVVQRAIAACASGNYNPQNHFVETDEKVFIGSGAQRDRGDWYLTRLACYLIAMNAESSKPEVGHAMTYFAAQTRRQEIRERQLTDEEKRVQLRLRVMDNNHRLAGAAKAAGVIRYPVFQDAGYRGLYGMSLAEVRARKKLLPSEDLLDNVGRLELSAHDFKTTLTEERLRRDQVRTEQRAIDTHRNVGQEVRNVMVRENGIRPEDLPKEPSIKRIVQKQRKAIKHGRTK
jgi:DNA-damage-inducible protein D